jgi:hypothetical protein
MTTLTGALADLLENLDLSVEEAAARHISPDFRQRTNGDWDDRAGFLVRITQLRRDTQQMTMTVLDELSDGTRYAERHIIELLFIDGRRVSQEVYIFATLDSDDRFQRIEEVTLPVGAST